MREQRKNKLELKSGANVYCIEIDPQGRIYIAVVTAAYPVRHIFSAGAAASPTPKLMTQFQSHVTATTGDRSLTAPPGGLKRELKRFLADLAARFDDLDSLDRVVAVQHKVDALKDKLVTTISAADERRSLLEDADEKTRQLASGAQAYYKRSNTLRRRACCALCAAWVWFFVAIIVVLLVGAGIVVGLNYSVRRAAGMRARTSALHHACPRTLAQVYHWWK